MDDNVITPPWKKNLRPAGVLDQPKMQEGRLTQITLRAAMLSALDKVGAEAFFLRFINGSAEHQRAFLQLVARSIPQQVEMDATLTVKVVTQLGEKVIELDGGREANLKLPPKDVATGARLPVVRPGGDAPQVPDPVDG